jgi:hypothetical protein
MRLRSARATPGYYGAASARRTAAALLAFTDCSGGFCFAWLAFAAGRRGLLAFAFVFAGAAPGLPRSRISIDTPSMTTMVGTPVARVSWKFE